VKRSELEKRIFAQPEDDISSTERKRAHSDSNDSAELEKDDKERRHRRKDQQQKKKRKSSQGEEDEESRSSEATAESPLKPSVQALLDFATSTNVSARKSMDSFQQDPHAELEQKEEHKSEDESVQKSRIELDPKAKLGVESEPNFEMGVKRTPKAAAPNVVAFGTLEDLVAAAKSEKKSDEAVNALRDIKRHVEWSESEREDEDAENERRAAIRKGDTIQLPGFTSILPQLPEEPEVATPKKYKKRKFKGILDDDSAETKRNGKSKYEKKTMKKGKGDSKDADSSIVEYPYPIDTWWPSVTSIRRERKLAGQPQDEDDFEDDPDTEDKSPFRVNTIKLQEKLSNEVTPGVLEKIPHCRIHRMLMKKRKNPSAPELVHCFQVTELYPNDVMVCCSICGTWRHTACGGHHKPFSVRDSIDKPFVAVCDRCHEEEKIIRDYPLARKRLDRQRCEQVRRGLATSAAMRQASFSKHGGTYKWPLGSVSATHSGGHTRSVHSRHDKAEKQWMDMATRLGRGYGYRPKERVKVRTKELERLLVSVEDAEGHTDRHNMMLFLLQDTMKRHPVGFEARRRNIFDPEEDEIHGEDKNPDTPRSPASLSKDGEKTSSTEGSERSKSDETNGEDDHSSRKKEPSRCARYGCSKKPRFDSLFCSDSCGVSALESDLLRTFQYASDIHPSLLRN